MRVQEILLENSKKYMLIDEKGIPIVPVVKYLKYLTVQVKVGILKRHTVMP